jgi:hypothetical protein
MKDGFLAQVRVNFFFIVSLCGTDALFVPQLHVALFIT